MTRITMIATRSRTTTVTISDNHNGLDNNQMIQSTKQQTSTAALLEASNYDGTFIGNTHLWALSAQKILHTKMHIFNLIQ